VSIGFGIAPRIDPSPAVRARRGAELLDLASPGWASQVRRPVRVQSACDCPLGQVFGSYIRGLLALLANPATRAQLREPTHLRDRAMLGSGSLMERLGFDGSLHDNVGALNRAWRGEILVRGGRQPGWVGRLWSALGRPAP
jgi:hypothetical protein